MKTLLIINLIVASAMVISMLAIIYESALKLGWKKSFFKLLSFSPASIRFLLLSLMPVFNIVLFITSVIHWDTVVENTVKSLEESSKFKRVSNESEGE